MVGDCRRNLVGCCRWIESGVPGKEARNRFLFALSDNGNVLVFGASQHAPVTTHREEDTGHWVARILGLGAWGGVVRRTVAIGLTVVDARAGNEVARGRANVGVCEWELWEGGWGLSGSGLFWSLAG